MVTGLHTGHVGLTVELHDEAPPVEEVWEDVVEVSFTPASATVALVEWGGASWPLALQRVGYRVRYCASGMDEARQVNVRFDDEPALDRYVLQFWPAALGGDRVVKQTSTSAAYWHDWARGLPPPPTPAEVAEAERRRAAAQRQADLEARERLQGVEDDLFWGGVPPSERVRTLRANVIGLAELDRPLVEALAETDPDSQRAIARWAARRAYDAAGLWSLEWVAPALAALERGEELPAPFDDPVAVSRALYGEDLAVRAVPVRIDEHTRTTGDQDNIDPQAAALPALFAAAEADPLVAAVDAVHAAAITVGDKYPSLLQELRSTFPELR
jgi:hypothetical protein